MEYCDKKSSFIKGLKDAIPIGLGYFAVAFSLGIAAKKAGLDAIEGLLASLLCNASAGEYAGFAVIAGDAPYFQMALVIAVTNARYFLMGSALCQKIDPTLKFRHRLIIGFDLTDELFGLAINQKGYVHPFYMYGAMVSSIPFWAVGTVLGIIAGSILPVIVVNALSVSLYGMFLAIIIPKSKTDKKLIIIILVCFIMSYCFHTIKGLKELGEGTIIIILTILLSTIFALIFPKKDKENES